MSAGKLPESVMVFAAGLGTRMRPITDTLPKPLVRVGGKCLIDHMLDRLAEAGVSQAVVNVHYLADQVEAHLRGRAAPRVAVSDERARLLDQGGGIKRALPRLGSGPFFACNTDAFWVAEREPVLARLAQAFDPARMDMLLLVADTATSIGVEGQGDFDMSADSRLTRRREGHKAAYVYTGVAILKPDPFAQTRDEVFRLAPFFFDAAARGRLYGYRLAATWLHVGTPAAVAEAGAVMESAAMAQAARLPAGA